MKVSRVNSTGIAMEQTIRSTNNNIMAPQPLRSDLVGLKSKLASISAERNILQETLRQIQNRVAQDVESSLHQQSQNYEARLTELHSVIAELRKQLDVQRANVIPEESCEESCGEEETQTDDLEVFVPSDLDPDELSNGTGAEDEDDEDEDEGEDENENEESIQNPPVPLYSSRHPNPGGQQQEEPHPQPQPHPQPSTQLKMKNRENLNEVNDKGIQADEFDCPCRVVTTSSLVTTTKTTTTSPLHPPTSPMNHRNSRWSQTGDNRGTVSTLPPSTTNKESEGAENKNKQSIPPSPIFQSTSTQNSVGGGGGAGGPTSPLSPIASLCKEVAQIREEHVAIRHNLMRKEGELDKTKTALTKIAQERDSLQRKVTDLEFMLKDSPRQFPQFISFPQNGGRYPSSQAALPAPASEQMYASPQYKMAERVRLRTSVDTGGSPRNSPTTPNSPMLHHNQNNNNLNNSKDQRPKYRHHSRNQSQQVISGAHLVSIGGNCKSRVVEQLTSPIRGESMVQEMDTVLSSGESEMIRDKAREYEVEIERLTSRCEHFRAQNDVLSINLAEAKGQANHLATLLGKYESNNVALQMTLAYSDHAIDAYDVLVALLESELGQLLANCRAVGIGSGGSSGSGCGSSSQSQSSGIGTLSQCPDSHHGSSRTLSSKDSKEELEPEDESHVKSLLQRANENRFVAENAARTLLSRLLLDTGSPGSENNNHGGSPTGNPLPQSSPPAWEDNSCCSQTLSSASSLGERSSLRSQFPSGSLSGSSGIGCSGTNELRIRELIIQLKTDRESVRSTVMDLDSSWSLEPESPLDKSPPSPCDILEAHKLDLEIAVLMQELMAMREERAELRAQLFHLEKDKDSMGLMVQKYEVQEEAYKARINYFKGEIESLQQGKDSTANDNEKDANANGNETTVPPHVERERILKNRVQELASSLEKVSQSSTQRDIQCTDMINELKRANGILIETLEGLKRKYQARVHKMEEQVMAIVERHSIQLKLYKDRVHFLEIEMDGRRN